MSWNQVAGQWKHFQIKVKEEWGRFAESEAETTLEKRDQLLRTLQKCYGYERSRAEQELDMLARLVKH